MKKRITFIMVTACILFITGCGASNIAEDSAETDNQIEVTYVENVEQTDTEENIATDGVADYPAAIMVNGTVYLVEGDPMPAEVDESAIIGYTESYTGTFPENNGETNFNPELGMPYAQVEGGIAVLYKNEWYLGTPFSNENTITFIGIIIDHTLESLVPVICVKTLDEEVIPYEAVFFELPEGEEDWALKIGEVVCITCSGGFTEPAPHYGTLISINDADIDVLSTLDGVTMEVTECSNTSVTKHKVGLLGTIFTMTDDFFKNPFYSSDIEIITPTAEEMEYINCKISSELELGIVKQKTLQGFQKIIKRMAEEEGIEVIILGCTELPLLLNDEVSPVPCLDTMKIHIQHLIDWIIE